MGWFVFRIAKSLSVKLEIVQCIDVESTLFRSQQPSMRGCIVLGRNANEKVASQAARPVENISGAKRMPRFFGSPTPLRNPYRGSALKVKQPCIGRV